MNAKQQIAVIGAGLVAGYIAYEFLKAESSKAVETAVNLVNPASDENVIYRATTGVTKTLSGGKYLSLGDWLYGITHDEPTL